MFPVTVLAVVVFAARELTASDFDDVVEHRAFVKFFVPRCGPCEKMKPAWDHLEKAYFNSTHVTIAEVNCTGAGAAVCRQQGVSSYPTIKYFIRGNPGYYKGRHDLHSLTTFVMDTFAPICNVNSGEYCDDVEKAIIMNYRGANLTSEIETILDTRRRQTEMFDMLKRQFQVEQARTQKHIDIVKYMKLVQHLQQQRTQGGPKK